jgi:serine/threonine protein kinase
MLTGCQPYNSNDFISLDEQVLNKSIPFSKIQNYQLRDLCKKLCNKNPIKRVNAKEALEIAYDIRDEIEKCELQEQFEQLDTKKKGKLSLETLRNHFNLDLNEEGDGNKLINFEQFYQMVINSIKDY